MITISLNNHQWTFDESKPVGPPGGFGEVFRGSGPSGEVAIKRLKLSAGAAAYREMKIGEFLADRDYNHVVPVLDFGQDADSDRYYLVMPLCEQSLQDRIASGTAIEWDEAKQALLNIVSGLQEVGEIVHRDLKPANVLFLDGCWRIADFGIAKFVEDSTSLETLRESLTPLYAAPEQWKGERSTAATDVYALGCIVHALLNGQPPFLGDLDAVRCGHLNEVPPSLTAVDPRLDGLVKLMLRKSPVSRPSLHRLVQVLGEIGTQTSKARFAALAAADSVVANEQSKAEAAARVIAEEQQARSMLAKEGIADLKRIAKQFFTDVKEQTNTAEITKNGLRLGEATIVIDEPREVQPGSEDWDIVAQSKIAVRGAIKERYSASDPTFYEFEATVFFGKSKAEPEYRWREVSFWSFGNHMNGSQPSALPAGGRDFNYALSNVMHSWNVAHGPWAIDGEDEEKFHDRWANLLARAANGNLRPSNSMPLNESYFH